MAIIFGCKDITEQQKSDVLKTLDSYKGEISQLSFSGKTVQIVINDEQIIRERGQRFLEDIIEILNPERWGSDLPRTIRERVNPPEEYSRYRINIHYDPNLS